MINSQLTPIIKSLAVWLLMYGIYDPVRKCFYDPEDPPPLTSAEQSSSGFLDSVFNDIYINSSSHLFQNQNSISVP